ncbi:hypothetical protein ACIBEA_39665 [Streptomyces sp. NPDC051555]|uniref:hypothetical protein n=1 Tax=Streptomyces sp. NPDC051555 TaxID=3365657 RepID=UPI00378E9185
MITPHIQMHAPDRNPSPGSARTGDVTPADAEPGSEAPWREFANFFTYLRQIGGLLAQVGISSPAEQAEVDSIAATLRAAIGYLLYTRTQPLTVPQVTDDLGTPPHLTSHALEALHEEGALVRTGGLFWVRDDGGQLPTVRDWVLMRLRAQLAGGVHPPGRKISEDALAAALGIGKYEVAECLSVLKREQVVRGSAWAWFPRVRPVGLAAAPRLPLPVPPPAPYSRTEVLEAVAPLGHGFYHTSVAVRPGSGSWHRARALAAQVVAELPAAENEPQEFAFGMLREIAGALAPHEPSARAWHTACVAEAIRTALVLLPPAALPADPSGDRA